MKLTGTKIKEAIKIRQLELTTLWTLFTDSLKAFVGDTVTNPQSIMDRIDTLENEVAQLQEVQSEYNLRMNVTIDNIGYTLCYLIKAQGGNIRIANKWKEVAKGNKSSTRYSYGFDTRSKDQEIAKPTITKEDALKEAIASEKIVNKFKEAIAVGNSKEIEFDDSYSKLFE